METPLGHHRTGSGLKCPHCGKYIDEPIQQKAKWQESTFAIIFALLCLGPFALPMVWRNQRYSTTTKTVISIVVLGVTIALVMLIIILVRSILSQIMDMDLFST